METERLDEETTRSQRTRAESLDAPFTGRERDQQNRIDTMINVNPKSNLHGGEGVLQDIRTLNNIEDKEHENEIHDMADQNPEKLNFCDELPSAQTLGSENKACRICLWDDEEEGNPIIQPCKCKGTMKNVHIDCFKNWIGKKVDRKESQSMTSVFWKRLQCEICHTEVSRK